MYFYYWQPIKTLNDVTFLNGSPKTIAPDILKEGRLRALCMLFPLGGDISHPVLSGHTLIRTQIIDGSTNFWLGFSFLSHLNDSEVWKNGQLH